MKFLKLVPLLLMVILFNTSCGVAKSISAAAFGVTSNTPSEAGVRFLNVGNGYQGEDEITWASDPYGDYVMALTESIMTLKRVSPEAMEPYLVQMNGKTFEYHYNLEELEKSQRSSIGERASRHVLGRIELNETGEFYIVTDDAAIPSDDSSSLESDNDSPYIHLSFTIDSPGMYFFMLDKHCIFIHKP